jgi:hypothetical protein
VTRRDDLAFNQCARTGYLTNPFFAERAANVGAVNVFDHWLLDACRANPEVSVARPNQLGECSGTTKGAGRIPFCLLHKAWTVD